MGWGPGLSGSGVYSPTAHDRSVLLLESTLLPALKGLTISHSQTVKFGVSNINVGIVT